MSNSKKLNVFPSVYPSDNPSYVPSYLPIVNPYIVPREQQVGAIQESRWTTREQVKAMYNMIASGDIKVDEAAQLRELVEFTCWRLI